MSDESYILFREIINNVIHYGSIIAVVVFVVRDIRRWWRDKED